MQTEIIAALVTLGGVIASVVISFLVSQRQLRTQIETMRYQTEQGYTSKLYEKRISIYPELYAVLSAFSKRAREEGISKRALDEFARDLSAWDSYNALFCSTFTVRQLVALRKAIRRFQAEGQGISRTKMSEEMTPILFELELALKTELGVFASEGYHSPTEVRGGPVRPLKEAIDDMRDTSADQT